MDMVNPLPLGTAVKIHIANDIGSFGAIAEVVYCQPHLGMGLVFQQVEPNQQPALQKWLDRPLDEPS